MTDSEPPPNTPSWPTSPALRVTLCTAAVAATALFAWYTMTRSATVTHGFTMYYVYARLLVEGTEFEKTYDYEYFNRKVGEYGIGGITDMPNNLPTNSFVLAPLAFLSPSGAKVALSWVSFLCVAGSLVIVLRVYQVSMFGTTGFLVWTMFFLWRPVYENIFLGQIYALLLLLFSLALYGIARGNRFVPPFSLALTILAKGYGVVPLAWFAFQRRWRDILLVFLAVTGLVLLTLPLLGIGSWVSFFSLVVSTLGTLPTDAHVAFQTINSFVFHLFSYDPTWLPSPLAVIPGSLLRIASYVLNLGLIAFVLWHGREPRPQDTPLTFAAAIAAGVVTAPLAEEYHFTLFLPYAAGIIAVIAQRIQRGLRMQWIDAISLGGIALMAVPIRYETLQFEPFPVVLLAYPKLAAGIVLLACFPPLLSRIRREDTQRFQQSTPIVPFD